MQLYNVVLEDKEGEMHTIACMCSSKYEASSLAVNVVAESDKLKEKGFLVIDIKMVNVEDTVEYVNTITLVDQMEGQKDE
jgi:hypothetical protein